MSDDLQVFAAPRAGSAAVPGQYRPSQWSAQAQVMITIAAQYAQVLGFQQPQQTSAQVIDSQANPSPTGTPAPANATPTFLVFDCVTRLNHSQPMTATEHPVQDSANITDHVKLNQAHISIDVVMSDVMPAYAAGQWIGNASKSLACFQTLDNIRSSRIPLTLTTRLKTYNNVFIMDILPDESVKSLHGFRGRIEFKQIFIASVSTLAVSARPQSTDNTSQGQVNPLPVPAGVQAQNGLPSTATRAPSSAQLQSTRGTVIGAGNYSSNNTSALAPAGAP